MAAPRLKPTEDEARFLKRVLLLVAVFALVMFVWKAADLLLLVFGAILAAVLFSAGADWIAAKTGVPRGLGLALTALAVLGVLALIGWLFGSETGRQGHELMAKLPGDWARTQARLGANPLGRMALDSAAAAAKGSGVGKVAAGVAVAGGQVLVNFVIVLVGGVFFAAEPERYRQGLIRLFPPSYRPVIADAVEDVARVLRLWLVTELVAMVVLGALVALGLWWAGVESWLALGILSGLSEFIPYVGPVMAMIPAFVVAGAGGGSLGWVVATYVVVRIVQTNLLTPLISQRLVHVPPGLYLFLILAAGYAFGTFGLFFSGALAVVGYTLALRLYSRETLGDAVTLAGEE